jgi:2-polyprenyl-6-methoxyphenol hydroxylase-like FAD-dependent oxidoreductase
MSTLHRDYDVAILGAGPAGAVAAIAFARRGARVLLAEANPNAASRLAGEWLHPPGVQVLARLGLLPIAAASGHGAGRGFVVFPDDGDDPIRLPYPDGAEGLSCDHRAFVDALRARAEACPGVDYLPGTRVVAIDDGSVTLATRGRATRTVSTGLVIGADGRASLSRGWLGIGDNSTPLSHMAGVELRDVDLPFEGYGHVILGGPGPILLYRIDPDRARACLDIPLDRCPRRRDADLLWRMFRPVLPERLVPAFREALRDGRVRWTTTRFRPRSHYGRGRVALVGDAVGYFHPLTAAGMTLGLQDAELLAQSAAVDDYRRRRERQSYVAELLSNSLYHALSREDASVAPVRTAVYRMWGASEQERIRTMRLLITEDHHSASFAAAFLKVAIGAFKHLVLGSPRADWWRQFPALAEVLQGPGSLLQWPAALLIPHVIRSAYQSRSTVLAPIPPLRSIATLLAPRPAPPEPAAPSSQPSEMDARVGLASAVGAIADVLAAEAGAPGGLEQGPRAVEVLGRTRAHLGSGVGISVLLAAPRRRLEELLSPVDGPGDGRTSAWMASALLALLADPAAEGPAPEDLFVAVEALLRRQGADGGFARVERPPRRVLGLVRGAGRADLRSTVLCCRALAAVRGRHPWLQPDRVAVALARACTWIEERQTASGGWAGPTGRPVVTATAAAIEALAAAGFRPTARSQRRAGVWARRRQSDAGTWTEPGVPSWAPTARLAHALMAARSAEIDAIERAVHALLEPTGWNGGADPSLSDLCAIAEALAAFLDWSRDVPGDAPGRHRAADLPAPPPPALRSTSLEA